MIVFLVSLAAVTIVIGALFVEDVKRFRRLTLLGFVLLLLANLLALLGVGGT